MALENQKIIYKDILVHCVHVSVQEYQKKMKMYQKKVTKKRFMDCVLQPEVQYINIYTKTAKRLGVFAEITEEFDKTNQSQVGGYINENGEFHPY